MATTARRGHMDRLQASIEPFSRFFNGPVWARNADPGVANFAVGNPQQMPLPAYVDALSRWLPPQDKDWFAYKLSEPESQRVVAESLTRHTGLAWDPQDVAMTNGGFAAIAVTLRTLGEAGDDVTFATPPWFFY